MLLDPLSGAQSWLTVLWHGAAIALGIEGDRQAPPVRNGLGPRSLSSPHPWQLPKEGCGADPNGLCHAGTGQTPTAAPPILSTPSRPKEGCSADPSGLLCHAGTGQAPTARPPVLNEGCGADPSGQCVPLQ